LVLAPNLELFVESKPVYLEWLKQNVCVGVPGRCVLRNEGLKFYGTGAAASYILMFNEKDVFSMHFQVANGS